MTRTSPTYFEQLYAGHPDPWGFTSSPYEARKYAVTVASLPREHYRSTFEPGCSVGVLTAALADRTRHLLATDMIPAAVEQARQRIGDRVGVEVECRTVPEEWPAGPFDLIVLSEMAYYFGPDELGVLLDRALASLEPGGHLLAVHWRSETDYPLSGDATHRLIGARPSLHRIVEHRERDFILECWEYLR